MIVVKKLLEKENCSNSQQTRRRNSRNISGVTSSPEMLDDSDASVGIHSNIFGSSEGARVHHYADLGNIYPAVRRADATLADSDCVYIDLENHTSEDGNHICTYLRDRDLKRPGLPQTLEHLGRISINSREHNQPDVDLDRKAAHWHRIHTDLEDHTC
jgi:hypothetical protein